MEDQSNYEKRLRAAIEEINAQIRDLALERQALERQLGKALRDDAKRIIGKVTRKNGYNKKLAEDCITTALTGKNWVSSALLFREARRVIYDLKDVTFRGYLSRMKDKGLVENNGKRGQWRLVANKPKLPAESATILSIKDKILVAVND